MHIRNIAHILHSWALNSLPLLCYTAVARSSGLILVWHGRCPANRKCWARPHLSIVRQTTALSQHQLIPTAELGFVIYIKTTKANFITVFSL